MDIIMGIRKTVASLLAFSVFTTALAGCSVISNSKAEIIESIPMQFVTALAAGDTAGINAVTTGYNYMSDFGQDENYDPDVMAVVGYAIARTTITNDSEPLFEEGGDEAQMDVTVTYIDLSRFMADRDSTYMTTEEYRASLEVYDRFEEKELTLEFVYNPDYDQWYMTKESSRQITRLFIAEMDMIVAPVDLSREDAMLMVQNCLGDLARTGTSDVLYDYDIDDYRIYDNIIERGEGSNSSAALMRFIKAYISYVLEHDYTIEEDGSFTFTLTGVAPSSEQLYELLTTDEFLVEYYANNIRYNNLGMNTDYSWDSQSTLIYDTLTAAIPDLDPEEYQVNLTVDPYGSSYRTVTLTSDLIIDPGRGIFEAEHGIGLEQTMRCIEDAILLLYERGEISEHFMELMLENITPENLGFTADDETISPLGHPNQAVGTYEQESDWDEDNDYVYGHSNPDENGIWMYYIKSPDILDSVTYYVDETGIWITCYFVEPFTEGTVLENDWYLNDEIYLEDDTYEVMRSREDAIELYLECDILENGGSYCLEVYQEGSRQNLAYVVLCR